MNTYTDSKMIGNAPEFHALLRSLEIAAATDVTVMLQGESGTGKELLAKFLHQKSHRRQAPFAAINCAALLADLAESELFGHRKGAFTGAVTNNPGRIESAEGGTLFLDEIAEMSLVVQAKLLRFLESGEYQAVGDVTRKVANIRVIAATHGDLRQRVEQGAFREDLFYRLNVVPFHVPALRERTGDVALLVNDLTRQLGEKHGLPVPKYDPESFAILKTYAWPGNVRELRNFCERMLILFSGRKVSAGNLPQEMRAPASANDTFFSLPTSGIRLDELEQDLLRQALRRTVGNQSQAARLLGMSRDRFLYRLKKYSIS